jgi:glycosyltransferase involved in cell wall biosynthesis
VSTVVHETTRRLADRFEFWIAGGATGRIPANEVPGIEYCALGDWADRRLFDNWVALRERLARHHEHAYYRRSYHPRYARRAAAWFERAGCDIVLVHEMPQWLPVVRRRLPDARLVFWAHSVLMVEGEADRLCRYIALADAVIGCSGFATRRIEARVPQLRGRGYVVANGFDPERFATDPECERSADLLAYVGRVTPEKGVHVLVDAFRRLAETYPDLELVIAGPAWISDPLMLARSAPDQLREIRALAEDYHGELLRRAGAARERLHLIGNLSRDDLARLYRQCTVLVQPSIVPEGAPLTVVEGMACGAAVVVSERGSLPDLVEPGATGLVVPAGDPRALEAALARLLDAPDFRQRLGSAAAHVASSRYTWSRAADSLAQVLSALSTSDAPDLADPMPR